MRFVLLASLIPIMTACALGPEAAEPIQAAPPDADTSPMQTPSVDVLASSLDSYCTRDDECVAVYEGNACAPRRCANAAIRRDALPQYRAALGAYWSCQEAEATADCTQAIGDPALCVAGRCTLSPL